MKAIRNVYKILVGKQSWEAPVPERAALMENINTDPKRIGEGVD
jgi:hypothetical protein